MAASAKANSSGSTQQISGQISKALKCLNDTEELMNKIFEYCEQLYKQTPTEESIKTIQSYLLDNVNTVGEHIFGVSRRVESLFNAQLDELDNLQSEMTSINHRLTSAEGFISNAFMLKFRGLPRKPIRILVRSQVLRPEQLPRASKKRKPWTRQKEIDYTVLDQIGAPGSGHRQSEVLDPDGAGSSNQSRPSYMNYQNQNKRTSIRSQQAVNTAPPKLSANPSGSSYQQPLQPPQPLQQPPSLSSRGPGAPPPHVGGGPPAVPRQNYGEPAPPANPMPAPPGHSSGPPPGPGRPPASPAPPPGPGMRPPPGPGAPPPGPGAPPPGPGGPPAAPPGPPRPPPGAAAAPGGIDVSNPDYERFKKMIRIGVPKQSVRNKLEASGLNPDAVDYF